MKHFFQKKRRIVMTLIWLLTVALNAAAWLSAPFCDWYTAHVFPIWLNTYGRLSGLFSVSIGEWMLYLAAVLVLLALVLWIVWLPVHVIQRCVRGTRQSDAERKRADCAEQGGVYDLESGRADCAEQGGAYDLESGSADCPKQGGACALESGRACGTERGGVSEQVGLAAEESGNVRTVCHSGFDRFVLRFYQTMAWIVTVVCLIMTLNCLILYHCTPLQNEGEQYDIEELIALRERIVINCNRLSERMQRDERGEIIYEGNMKKRAVQAMHTLAEREGISRLEGYYSEPKPLYASWFFCQQYMCGYYFPFSLEANYNDMMYIMNYPYTMCHELSHLKGYIYENEANYLAYLACVESGDEVFEYSGYLNVMYYVERDLIDALMQRGEMARYESLTPVKEQVHLDNVYVTSDQWEKVNEQSPLDTQFVSDVTDSFLEANLTVNGVSDGVVSYSRVVGLLLSYYHEEQD